MLRPAVAWVFGNISMYGGSPERIYLAGHSAGGYLVDMVSLDKSRLKRYGVDANSIKGVIPFSGQVITHFEERRLCAAYRTASPWLTVSLRSTTCAVTRPDADTLG